MSLKLHLGLLILLSIILLFVVSTLSATTDNTKPVFVYAKSAVTPTPPSSTAPDALPAIWPASGD
jgi:hypothetical protein